MYQALFISAHTLEPGNEANIYSISPLVSQTRRILLVICEKNKQVVGVVELGRHSQLVYLTSQSCQSREPVVAEQGAKEPLRDPVEKTMLVSWTIIVCHYVLHTCVHSVSHLFAHSYPYYLTDKENFPACKLRGRQGSSRARGAGAVPTVATSKKLVRKGAGCSRGGSQLTSSEHVYVTRSIMKRAAQNGTSFFISRSLQMVECVLTVFVMFFYKTVHLD